MLKIASRSKLYKQLGVVGLDFCFVSRFVAHNAAATVTFVNDDVSLFRVGQGLDGAQNAAAIVCSVTRVYINV